MTPNSQLRSNATHIVGGLAPPPGVTPNFVNPDSLHTEWVLTLSTCIIFPTIFIMLRMYTKLILIKSHGWEDYTSFIAWRLIALSQLGLIGYLAIDFVAFGNGAGIHQWNVPVEQVKIFAQAVNAKEVCNGPVIYFVKLSILLQFMRIFVPSKTGPAYYFIQSVNWLNLLFYSAYTIASSMHCIPRRKIWEPHTPGKCLDIAKLIIVSSIINIVSDLAMFMIPLFCISSLQMPFKRKLGISIVFATGIFACLTSVLRSVNSFRILGKHDQTYELIPLAFWSDAEIASGIICGCMPVLPQFFRHFLPKLKSTFIGSSGLYSRRSGRSARKVDPIESGSTGRKHHLSSSSVTGKQRDEPTTAPWDDYDDVRQLHTGDRADEEDGIDLQSLPEARTRRRSSEHDEGLVVRGDAGYNRDGFESVESIAREQRGDLERGLGR